MHVVSDAAELLAAHAYERLDEAAERSASRLVHQQQGDVVTVDEIAAAV